jgi:predicted CoA-binding protein
MKTLVFGASMKEERYSNIAINMLLDYGHEVVAIGGRNGEVKGVEIKTGHPEFADIHTITMYMGAKRQEDHMDYLMGLSPKRVIFNPGAENATFEHMLREKGVEVLRACTLVMLRTGQYEMEMNME